MVRWRKIKRSLKMVQDYPSSKNRTEVVVAKEVLATLASLVIYPFGINQKNRQTPRIQELRTVVFIHGYLANRSCMRPLAQFLKFRGYKNQLDFQYSSKMGVLQAAIQLKKFLKHYVRGGRIDLVCHSLGGLVARAFLQELGGNRRVDHCITIGTPHSGTYNSYWLWSRIGRELRPDSPLIKRLTMSRHQAAQVRQLAIVGGADNIIIPRVFAEHTADSIQISGVGHLGLLFSPQVYKIIADRLLAPDPLPPHP